MKSKTALFINSFILLFFFSFSLLFSVENELLKNGDAERVWINEIEQVKDYKTFIHPDGRNIPVYWTLSSGAALTTKDKYSGKFSVMLRENKKKEAKAIVRTHHWTYKDSDYPFGIPIFPNKKIKISFYYKTKGVKKNFKAVINIGVKLNENVRRNRLSSYKEEIILKPSRKWKKFEKDIVVNKLYWNGAIDFILFPSKRKGVAWVDKVSMVQEEPEGINLLKNGDFERFENTKGLPDFWEKPIADQWENWKGIRYVLPKIDKYQSVSGNNSLKMDVTYGDLCGLMQMVRLNQRKVKPIIIDVYSKIVNTIGNITGYKGPDNLNNITVYIYYKNGFMQEVSPTFLMGESEHGWYKQVFGFMPKEPIEDIYVQLTVIGSEPTTTLWVDKINLYELGTTEEELYERGVLFPQKSLSSVYNDNFPMNDSLVSAANNEKYLFIKIAKKYSDNVFLYLNPRIENFIYNDYRYLYWVFDLKNKRVGEVVEKQGYTAEGKFKKFSEEGISVNSDENYYFVKIPFVKYGIEQDKKKSIGFNVKWIGKNIKLWTGKKISNKWMGTLYLKEKQDINIESIRYGKRYYIEKNQSQDFVSYPQINRGDNEASFLIKNNGNEKSSVLIKAGIKGGSVIQKKLSFGKGETKNIKIKYNTGNKDKATFFICMREGNKKLLYEEFPLAIPPTIETVMDQYFYYPEEEKASIEIYNRKYPLALKNSFYKIEVLDLKEGKGVLSLQSKVKGIKTVVSMDISKLRINKQPIQDYKLKVSYYEKDKKEGEAFQLFGRLIHPVRPKLPPIKNLKINDKGIAVINENFRFFPIVPSHYALENESWDKAIDMGANIFRAWYNRNYDTFGALKRAWAKNAYLLTIGPSFDDQVRKRFKKEADSLISHPGFFAAYAKQIYYWKPRKDLIDYRKEIEREIAKVKIPKLVIWGHHDSSFLYDRTLPEWPITNPYVGYCVVKIMARPGPFWKNSPFLMETEKILNPKRFTLSEVNYYVSFHTDEIVPENFWGSLSIRGDDWRGVRNEFYQALINGAGGVYNWLCIQKRDLGRIRGFYHEVNDMWQIYVEDNIEGVLNILPENSGIKAVLKKHNGKYYLITANSSEKTQNSVKIIIKGMKIKSIKKLFELEGDMSYDGNTITDNWDRYGAHVYEIEIEKIIK